MEILVVYDDAVCRLAKELITERLQDIKPNVIFIDFDLELPLDNLKLDQIKAILIIHIPSDTNYKKVKSIIDIGTGKKLKMFSILYRIFEFQDQIPNILATKIFKPRFEEFPKYKNNLNYDKLFPFEIVFDDPDSNQADITEYISMLSNLIFETPNPEFSSPESSNPEPKSKWHRIKNFKFNFSFNLAIGFSFVLLCFVGINSLFLLKDSSPIINNNGNNSEKPVLAPVMDTQKKDNSKIKNNKTANNHPKNDSIELNKYTDSEKSKLFEKYIEDPLLIDSIFINGLFNNSDKFLRAKSAKMDFLKSSRLKVKFLETNISIYYGDYFKYIEEDYKKEILKEWYDNLLKVYGQKDNLAIKLGSTGVLNYRYINESDNSDFKVSWNKFYRIYRRVYKLTSFSEEEIICIGSQVGKIRKSKCEIESK